MQLKEGLRKARAVLGNGIPGLTDKDIEDSLWYYFFDVEKTVNYILSKNPRETCCQGQLNVQDLRVKS